ncbi:MAG: DUF1365 domain-containing protein [Caldimonas sp.]
MTRPAARAPGWADRPARPLIGIGQVRHARLRPVIHRFAYPTWFLLLPMRSWRAGAQSAVARNRLAWVSFHDADHGDGRADSLDWLDEVLAREGIADAAGEVWLHCYPRVLGFAFKPVSFWYCHRRDSSLAAVIVEVNNTFGERHCYLLHGDGLAFGREARATKAFHVSPFCSVAGDYRFRFMRNDLHPQGDSVRSGSPRTVARIDHHDADGLLLQTSVSGTLLPASARRLRSALLSMPFLMLGVVARIHWQALRLACKRVPFLKKPAPPETLVSR